MAGDDDHMGHDHLIDFLADQFAEVETAWSVGTFGAIAEFARASAEPADLQRTRDTISIVTDRGGFRIVTRPGLRPFASESPTAESWSHRIALCLPLDICAMNRRRTFTEIGPDQGALRSQDRDAILFDLGLGTLQIDACIRVGDPDVVAALRSRTGMPVFAPENDVMRIVLAAGPHRVFVSRIGRAEVFQPIPPPGGRSPDGPHTHVLPKLLAHGRTHAATEPVPEGWIPCAHLYPPHPLRDQFGRKRPFRKDYHEAFQPLLERYGEEELVALKRRVIDAVMAGSGPSTSTLPGDRFARAAVRVALRQLQALQTSSQALADWVASCDRTPSVEGGDPMEVLH